MKLLKMKHYLAFYPYLLTIVALVGLTSLNAGTAVKPLYQSSVLPFCAWGNGVPFDSVSIDENDSVMVVVDKMPEFPGGNEELMRFIGTNVRYPIESIKNRQQGRVYVGFIVDIDGSVSKVKVVRSSSYNLLDKEAVRLVKAMPKWTPGYQDGKLVKVSYVVPINFKTS
jgi:TonB family protein